VPRSNKVASRHNIGHQKQVFQLKKIAQFDKVLFLSFLDMMTSRLSGRSLAAVVERLQPNSSSFLTSNFRQMSTVKVSTPPKKAANNLVPPTKLVEKVTAAKPPSLDNQKKKESVQHFKCPKCDFTDESRINVKQVIFRI
jgi:hypothetical protein